mmetsp:Transcript_483/g.1295  ORF Transcript_483/g.1295 Transcript_483/m.1295 type:complete len:347 (-) Transcript_483:158-1198(-)
MRSLTVSKQRCAYAWMRAWWRALRFSSRRFWYTSSLSRLSSSNSSSLRATICALNASLSPSVMARRALSAVSLSHCARWRAASAVCCSACCLRASSMRVTASCLSSGASSSRRARSRWSSCLASFCMRRSISCASFMRSVSTSATSVRLSRPAAWSSLPPLAPSFFLLASSSARASSCSRSSSSRSMRSFSRRRASSRRRFSSAISASRAAVWRRSSASFSASSMASSASSLRFSIMILRALLILCSLSMVSSAVLIAAERRAACALLSSGCIMCTALDRRCVSCARWLRTWPLSSCCDPKCSVPLRWSMRTCRKSFFTASTTTASTSDRGMKLTSSASDCTRMVE